MLKRTSFLLSLALIVVMMPSLSSRGSDKPDKAASSKPVITITATFVDSASYRIQDDGLGAYVNGVANVAVVFQPTGNFTLDTNTSKSTAVRTLFLDFTSCAIGPCTPPLRTGYVDSYLSTDSDLFNGGPMATMLPGGTVVCNVQINLDIDSVANTQWFLNFGADTSTSPTRNPPNAYPETSQVLVTRTDTGTGPMTWTIAPVGNAVARLSGVTTKGKSVTTSQADYYMPFSLTVTQTK